MSDSTGLIVQGAALPALPPRVPTRRYTLGRPLGRLVMWLSGWKFVGGFADVERQVLIGWPHTSNWDGIIGLAGATICGIDVRIFAKRALFRFPTGILLREFGGIPVERGRSGGMVETAIERFAHAKATDTPFVLAIAPEGTRSRGKAWKTGFHRIAVEADVPVAMLGFDYGRKELGVIATLYMTGDLPTDMARIEAVYSGVQGRFPEKETPPTAGLLPASASGE